MPRKKSEPAAEILQFFRTQPLAVAEMVLSLAKGEVSARRPAEKKPVVRRRRKPVAVPPAPVDTPARRAEIVAPPSAVRQSQKRRMRANSKPPVSEATPLVPPAEQDARLAMDAEAENELATYEGQ